MCRGHWVDNWQVNKVSKYPDFILSGSIQSDKDQSASDTLLNLTVGFPGSLWPEHC
jgi:hypothetical protein